MTNKKQYEWLEDKESKKYKRYIEKRKKAMEETHRKRLDKLNKMPPSCKNKVENLKK
jgi:flagellar motility protein MotE (MotC chaperone)